MSEKQSLSIRSLLQCSIQYLIIIPGLRGAEGLAAEEGKIRPVGAVVAILAVAQDGAADAGHVGTDLVGAAGDELYFEQGQTAGNGNGLVL